MQSVSPIRLLAIMEASSVTGPAKNLIEFCRRAWLPLAQGKPAVEATIATFVRDGAPASNAFIEAARRAGVAVEIIGERRRFDPGVAARLGRLVERLRPDILQTHNVKSHFLLRGAGLWRSRPWVAFQHGYTTTDFKMRAYNQLDRWSLRAASRVVTTSEAFARDLRRRGIRPERLRVLHNSIDVERFENAGLEEGRALRARLGLGEGERVILAVGRLSREKGHADLIAALDHLRALRPGAAARLVIVGEGPERPHIEQAAASRGVASQVIFAGQVGDVWPFLSMADVMALPSHSEGSPNVLLEAMAARLPVVATAVGGVPEIVTHEETALLVPPRDASAMARALAALLTDEAAAHGLAARAYEAAVSNHSVAARMEFLLNLYRELAPRAALCGSL